VVVASAGHVQVCTSLQTDNHASTSPLSFLQGGCPSCRPTNSVKALKALTISTSRAAMPYLLNNINSENSDNLKTKKQHINTNYAKHKEISKKNKC